MKSIVLALWGLGLVWGQTGFAVDYDYERAKSEWDLETLQLGLADSSLQREESELVPFQQQVDRLRARVDSLTQTVQQLRTERQNANTERTQKRADLTRAESQKDDLERRLADYQNDLSDLLRDRDNLVNEIENLQDAVVDLEVLIRQLENAPGDGPWTCNYVDHGFEEHSRGHPATDDDRATAAAAAEAACLAVHGDCDPSSCTQPPSQELTRLRNQRDRMRADLDRKRSERERMDNEIRDLRDDVQDVRDDLVATNQNIQAINQRIRVLDNTLSSVATRIANTEDNLALAREDLAAARADLSRQQVSVDRARADRDTAFQKERAAFAYYQQVLANYNQGVADATGRGRSSAVSDSGREAAERAPLVGEADGTRKGADVGTAQGLAESKTIAQVQGYNFGLASGRTDASLAQAYADGIAVGSQRATEKAQAEVFPASYNGRLNEVLAAPPTNAATYDISEQLPDVPGASGPLQVPTPQAIGSVNGPQFPRKDEPTARVPDAGTPAVAVPAADRRYFAPRCDGEVLPAFVRACTDAYSSNYASGFDSGYRSSYQARYSSAFRIAATSTYGSARQTAHPDLHRAQALVGAKDAGTLDGFAQSLADAKALAAQKGRQAFDALLARGFVPLLRSVTLAQSHEDGVLVPGEEVKLTVVIDNYGKLNSARGALRIRLTDLENVTFRVDLRDLPAVEADSRVTLTGVLQGAAAQAASRVAKLKAVLEQAGGTVLDEATFEAGIRMPLEFAAVTLPTGLRIGVAAEAVLSLKNNTAETLDAAVLPLSLSGEGLTTAATSVAMPELAAGATAQVRVPVTPNAFASTSLPVSFVLKPGSIGGSSALVLTKSVGVAVARAAVLDLCLPTCGAAVNLPLHVPAGTAFSIPLQFRFTGTQAQIFDYGKVAVSDPRITNLNNTTWRVGPGQWGPGSVPQTVYFQYQVATALRGTQQWLTLDIKSNGTTLQVLKVPLVID